MEQISEFCNLRKLVHRVYCDDCNVELKGMGMTYMTAPPKYPYICPQCSRKYVFDAEYPYTEIVGTEVKN